MGFSSFSFSNEVQDYLHSFESLLAALRRPDTVSRFSMEEREVLWHSFAELQRLLVVWDKKHTSFSKAAVAALCECVLCLRPVNLFGSTFVPPKFS